MDANAIIRLKTRGPFPDQYWLLGVFDPTPAEADVSNWYGWASWQDQAFARFDESQLSVTDELNVRLSGNAFGYPGDPIDRARTDPWNRCLSFNGCFVAWGYNIAVSPDDSPLFVRFQIELLRRGKA